MEKKFVEAKKDLQFKKIFNATPECYLIITPDIPYFTIIGVTDAYLESTQSQRINIIGKSVYELFSDNPNHKTQTATSFQRVLDNNCADEMGIIKHYIQTTAERNDLKEHIWNAVNYPVLGVDGKGCIYHPQSS